MKFEDLKLIDPILKALKDQNYIEPTDIQAKSIPLILNGDDVLGSAQTGTGKTAAFAIPIIQQLINSELNHQKNRKISSLIVTPTRELAIQIEENFKAYSKYTKLRSTVIFGGVSQHSQTRILSNGIDILIATPGRLLDLMNQGYITINDVKYFVLDEADRMLDMVSFMILKK
jgi:ATP-dependent RNA helicase RhlE